MASSSKELLKFSIISTNSSFRFYRTATSFSSEDLHPSIAVLKEIPYLLLPSKSSYAIYTLQDLKLQFLGPVFPHISCIAQAGAFVYVCCENTVFKTHRGEISEKLSFPGTSITSMVIFGPHFVMAADQQLIICECMENNSINGEKLADSQNFLKERYRLNFESKISVIFHPHSYTNKIFIAFEDGTSLLYNIDSNKEVFKFSLGCITAIAQTSVVDVVGIVMRDGRIQIYNLKKDKLIFEITGYIGKKIKRIDFKDKTAVIVGDGVFIYDLEFKKEIHYVSSAFSGSMINNEMALLTSGNSVEILTIDDLKILKSRKILNSGILQILQYSQNELLLVSKEKLFKMNVYRDEMNAFLKNKNPIELVDVDSATGFGIEHPTLVMYGEKKISYIDTNGKYHDFITQKCQFLRVFRDFCLFGTKTKIVIMNLKSKRVVLTHNINPGETVIDGFLDGASFSILYSNQICKYDFSSKVLFQYALPHSVESGNLQVCQETFFVVQKKIPRLTVIFTDVQGLDATNVSVREFEISSFSIDPSCKIIVGIKEMDILIFDILSGNLLERIITNKMLAGVAILDNIKFICVLDSESQVHLLSNLYHIGCITRFDIQETAEVPLKISIAKKESNFYRDLMLYKSFSTTSDHDLIIKGLTESEVKEMLAIVMKNIDNDFFSSQKLLNKILLYKSSIIDQQDLIEIKGKVDEKLRILENTVLKGIGYLSLRRD